MFLLLLFFFFFFLRIGRLTFKFEPYITRNICIRMVYQPGTHLVPSTSTCPSCPPPSYYYYYYCTVLLRPAVLNYTKNPSSVVVTWRRRHRISPSNQHWNDDDRNRSNKSRLMNEFSIGAFGNVDREMGRFNWAMFSIYLSDEDTAPLANRRPCS